MKVKNKVKYLEIESIDGLGAIKKACAEQRVFKATTMTIFQNFVSDLYFPMLHRFSSEKIFTNFGFDKTGYDVVSLDFLLTKLECLKEQPLDNITKSDRYQAFGVLNARRLFNLSTINKAHFPDYRHTLSFLWIGLSTGQMHFDIHNNFLLQLSGVKEIVIIPPEFNVIRSGKKYLSGYSRWEDDSVLEPCQWLAHIPHYKTILKPGEYVYIPSGAYHAPLALSYDSVSLNSFLIPKPFGYQYKSFEKKEEASLPYVNLMYSMSKLYYRLFGKPFLRSGPFEIM